MEWKEEDREVWQIRVTFYSVPKSKSNLEPLTFKVPGSLGQIHWTWTFGNSNVHFFSLEPERTAKRGLEATSTYAQRRIMSWLTFLISRPRWIFRSKSFLNIYRTFLPEQPVFLWVLHWEGGRSCTKLQPVILTVGVNKTATSLSSVLPSQPVLNLSRFVCFRIFMRVFMIIIQMWQNSLKLGENVL